MTRNAEVAALFDEYADVLEAQGDDYRPQSYRRAADRIRDYPKSVEDLAAEGVEALQDIEGVGESIAAKIVEYIETGTVETIDEARADLPADFGALMSVEGIGPKTVGRLYRELGIETLDDLETAARTGEIRELRGFGEKTEQNIVENLAFVRQAQERERLGDVRPIADRLLEHLGAGDAVEDCDIAGSLRRWCETIGDIDVLAAGDDHAAIVDRLRDWDEIDDVIEAGTAKASVRAVGLRVDLRVVDPDEWGSALQYFTGAKDHNIRLRNYAIDRNHKVNEYGVFDVSGIEDPDAGQRVGERIAGTTEESVYEALGLEWIPPELREDRGEIDAAADGELPALVGIEDIRGDLHVHTDWSDGSATLDTMIEEAAAFGHDYVCISDHATGPGVVGGMGLSDADIRDQVEQIRSAAADTPIEVFAGIEANIDAEGGISVGEDALAELDLVIASPHSGLDGDGTERLVVAAEHPRVDVLGHPTGRLINERPGLDVDADAVVRAAAAHDTALEINSNPARLDLRDETVRLAVDAGATIAINTDAHHPTEYTNVRYGIHTARRGWVESTDVLNARDVSGLRTFLT